MDSLPSSSLAAHLYNPWRYPRLMPSWRTRAMVVRRSPLAVERVSICMTQSCCCLEMFQPMICLKQIEEKMEIIQGQCQDSFKVEWVSGSGVDRLYVLLHTGGLLFARLYVQRIIICFLERLLTVIARITSDMNCYNVQFQILNISCLVHQMIKYRFWLWRRQFYCKTISLSDVNQQGLPKFTWRNRHPLRRRVRFPFPLDETMSRCHYAFSSLLTVWFFTTLSKPQ